MAERPGIAIIGAGWAGLACALELAAAGRAVTVYESAGQAGGRARSVPWQGLEIDNGQHLLLGAYRETLRLLHRVGTAERLVRLPLQWHMPPDFCLRAPPLPAPLHLAAALFTAIGLSWRDRWQAVRLLARLRATHYRLAADCSVAALLAYHGQGERLIKYLWQPLCLAALNTPIATASAQVFCHVLRDSLGSGRRDSKLLLPRGPLDALFAAPAMAWLTRHGSEIRLGARIRKIHPTAGGFRLDDRPAVYRHLVCAVHPAQVARLLPAAPALDSLRQQLAALRWQPITTIWLRYAQVPRLPFPMLGLWDGPGQWVFDRSDLGAGLVAVVVSAEGAHQSLPADVLAHRTDSQLRRLWPALPPLLRQQVITEKRATFACLPNLDRPINATALPGLYLAGDYTAGDYPATLEGAVRSGIQCSRSILAETSKDAKSNYTARQ